MKFPAERLPAEINKQYVSFATLLGQSALLLPLLKPTTNQPWFKAGPPQRTYSWNLHKIETQSETGLSAW